VSVQFETLIKEQPNALLPIFKSLHENDLINISRVNKVWRNWVINYINLAKCNLYINKKCIIHTLTIEGLSESLFFKTTRKVPTLFFSPEINLLGWRLESTKCLHLCDLNTWKIHRVLLPDDGIPYQPFLSENHLLLPYPNQLIRVDDLSTQPNVRLAVQINEGSIFTESKLGRVAAFSKTNDDNLVMVFNDGKLAWQIKEDVEGNADFKPCGATLTEKHIYIIYHDKRNDASKKYHLSIFSLENRTLSQRMDLKTCPWEILSDEKGLLIIYNDLRVDFFNSMDNTLKETSIHLGRQPKKAFLHKQKLITMYEQILQIYAIKEEDNIGSILCRELKGGYTDPLIAFSNNRIAISDKESLFVDIFDLQTLKNLCSYSLDEKPCSLCFRQGISAKNNFLMVGFANGDVGIWYPTLSKTGELSFIPSQPMLTNYQKDNYLTWIETSISDAYKSFLMLWDSILAFLSIKEMLSQAKELMLTLVDFILDYWDSLFEQDLTITMPGQDEKPGWFEEKTQSIRKFFSDLWDTLT